MGMLNVRTGEPEAPTFDQRLAAVPLSADEHGTSLARLRPTHADMVARIKAVKDVIARGCSDAELEVFAEVCRHTGLDPFTKQIYAIHRRGRDGDEGTLSIQTSVDGFRAKAEGTGKYRGRIGPQWCGEDGIWQDVWLKITAPAACRVGILRSDFDQPVWGVARTEAYRVETNPLWKKMPEVMVARSAETQAIRAAFPNELSGIYGTEEMEQADAPAAAPAPKHTTVREDRRIVEAARPQPAPKPTPAPAPKPAKVRKWASLQARAHAAQMYETQEEWTNLVLRICGLSMDPAKATNEDYDAVELSIADREQELAALNPDDGADAYDLHDIGTEKAHD